MDNQIVIRIENGALKQYVYIFSEDSDLTPIVQEATMENLLSVAAMAAAKYRIKKFRLSGAKDFTLGIKNQLTEKLTTCFGKIDDFNIELM
jgi:hypothetical protein